MSGKVARDNDSMRTETFAAMVTVTATPRKIWDDISGLSYYSLYDTPRCSTGLGQALYCFGNKERKRHGKEGKVFSFPQPEKFFDKASSFPLLCPVSIG